ncbi:nucleotide disphospho-sugar-binding domain-containing protein [Oerskovia flava]|uniref:nucleotide disphospho-sugar-binding domain-containing protein n=1 Tax=Oerskovia flava TaxID=2986422 RepID=UPI00223FB33C|nr:nucleotide disphospho-sugar-binding domain-containing protein [Oerskovia sp. JB1-3-2]
MDDGAARREAGPAPGPRTYLFALTDGGGTVPPELGVVRRLVDRGHHVTVLADASMTDQVRATGATDEPWEWQPAGELRDWALRSPTGLARAMADHLYAAPAPHQARQTSAALDRVRPDLVVASFGAAGAMIAAEARGLPFDVLLPNVYPMPAPGMPPFGLGLAPARGPLGRARDRVVSTASVRLFDRYALAPVNTVRAEYRLGPLATTWGQLGRARRQLVLTSAAFDFPARLPDNARYVGPVLDDPSWAAGPWEAPPGDGPLVLVAMSSTFQDHVACLQRIVDALGTLPVRGFVTTGPAVRPDALRAPPHVTVVTSAPHGDVLRQADLVVTHGGHGTVMKALAAGLPLVVLHHGRDQADNAVRVTTRGAGVAVRRRASSRTIARAVATVLASEPTRRAAARLGEAVERDARSSVLLDELENL